MTSLCACVLESATDELGEFWSTIVEALFSIALCTIGITLNLKILRKLRIEKRNKPLHRKGNVVEPIMRWFCRIQIVAWPLHLLFYWTWKNGYIPLDISTFICRPLILLVTSSRSITAYNSFCVALIRYFYIVLDKKSNQWHFETVGGIFQIGSILTPLIINTIVLLGLIPPMVNDAALKQACPHTYNATDPENDLLKSSAYELLTQYLPIPLVHTIGYSCIVIHGMVYLNITEAYLYIKMFVKMKKQHDESFARGILNEEIHNYYSCRRTISFKICFLGWLLELAGVAMTALTPTLHRLGLSNLYYPDAIIMFVLIPFLHISNDDETKEKIAVNGWFAGLQYILLGKQNLPN